MFWELFPEKCRKRCETSLVTPTSNPFHQQRFFLPPPPSSAVSNHHHLLDPSTPFVSIWPNPPLPMHSRIKKTFCWDTIKAFWLFLQKINILWQNWLNLCLLHTSLALLNPFCQICVWLWWLGCFTKICFSGLPPGSQKSYRVWIYSKIPIKCQ